MITDKKVEKSIFRTRNLHCPISPVVHEIKNKTILFSTIFFSGWLEICYFLSVLLAKNPETPLTGRSLKTG